MLFDTHCHLSLIKDKIINIFAVIENARASGVVSLVDVSVGTADFLSRVRLVEDLRNASGLRIYMTAGLPPYFSDKRQKNDLDTVRKQALRTGAVAIGEIGLDYFHRYGTNTEQIDLFSQQIALANELDLPIIVHTRESDTDLISTLKKTECACRGIIHCFSSDWNAAKALLDLGYYISFAGNVTYSKSETLREVARTVPQDRYLVETDSPYLSPQKFRGKPNEPARVAEVAACIAEIRGTDLKEVAEHTTQNACTVFRLSE
jgi:TatD DNase family protein